MMTDHVGFSVRAGRQSQRRIEPIWLLFRRMIDCAAKCFGLNNDAMQQLQGKDAGRGGTYLLALARVDTILRRGCVTGLSGAARACVARAEVVRGAVND